MNLSTFLALRNPVLNLLKPFSAIEHYFLTNQFLIKKQRVYSKDQSIKADSYCTYKKYHKMQRVDESCDNIHRVVKRASFAWSFVIKLLWQRKSIVIETPNNTAQSCVVLQIHRSKEGQSLMTRKNPPLFLLVAPLK